MEGGRQHIPYIVQRVSDAMKLKKVKIAWKMLRDGAEKGNLSGYLTRDRGWAHRCA